MEFKIRGMDKVKQLIQKGVSIPNPYSLDIGEEVKPEQISGQGVVIYPGCRIYGSRTVVSAGVQLGREGPVTLEDCQLGPQVELRAGYFSHAVFLEQASMGSGSHVREGCILEEEANGAHCVGLKQTILFPFVTLGSLVNFCDCLLAGGTGRQHHSEVGSSYIHFNFTPEGNKTTASLLGDVPRGVMLNQAPIFLGGQGGLVGPLRVAFGTVAAAGTILRKDVSEENKLVSDASRQERVMDYRPGFYPRLAHMLESNLLYLANLAALEEWYRHVRRPFFERRELGAWIYEGALHNLSLAKEERLKRLQALAEHVILAAGSQPVQKDKQQFFDQMGALKNLFTTEIASDPIQSQRGFFLKALAAYPEFKTGFYVESIQSLSTDTAAEGVQWLQAVVDEGCRRAAKYLSAFPLFKKAARSARKQRR